MKNSRGIGNCNMAHTYKSSYKRFIIKHTIFIILSFSGISLYFISVVNPAVQSIFGTSKIHGEQTLFSLIIPLIWTGLALVATFQHVKYYRAVLAVLRGKVLVKTGTIVLKQKRIYDVADILSKKAKKSVNPYFLSRVHFKIRDCDSECSLQVGNTVSVIYPASHVFYDKDGIPAIYVFSSEKSRPEYSISKRKIVFIATAILSVSYYFLWNSIWIALLAERGIAL